MNATLISAILLAAVAAPPAVGTEAPGFTLQTPKGETVRLGEQVADGPVVLVVLRGWTGSHCPACTSQVADLLKHRQEITRHAEHVVLVYPGITGGPGIAGGLGQRAGEFLAQDDHPQLPDPVTLVLDPDYSMINAYGLRWNAPKETAYPTTMVIDGEGIVRWMKTSETHKGRASAKEVLAALRAL